MLHWFCSYMVPTVRAFSRALGGCVVACTDSCQVEFLQPHVCCVLVCVSVAARKAKGHHTGTGRRTSKGDSTAAWMQQGQSGTTAASSSISSMSGLLQAAAGKSLRISLQGINSNVLRQSLGMLQGQLDAGEVEGDTVDIVVSGQLCLQRSPSPPHHHHHPQQQVRQPAPQQQQRRQQQQQQVSQRQHRRSSSANGGCDVVRHFDEQLQATKAAVAAASAGAGRAPLQSVLREMQSMIARMEAVCCRDEAPGSGRPLTQQAQQECKQSAATQAAQGQQPRHLRASPAHNGHSSSPDMPPRAYCNQRRPGSAGSITDWQQQAACCSPAFARSRSPRRQLMVGGQGGKLRSPDRHKLRGRLHTVQDRLARLEVSRAYTTMCWHVTAANMVAFLAAWCSKASRSVNFIYMSM